MSYLEHAKKEFKMAGWSDSKGEFKCDMQKLMCEQVLELLDVFASHGHSGSTYGYAINLFEKLAKFKTITPLTGDDCEWQDMGEGRFQNIRLSSVFKDSKNKPYDIDGRVYWEWFKGEEGDVYKTHYSKGGDKFYIEFPYEQKEAVQVFCPTDDYPNEIIKD